MSCRFLLGNRYGTNGMWITRPGYDCFNDDPYDTNKFFFSTHWNQRPLRFSASGLVNSATAIFIPSIPGAQPILYWRPMQSATSEIAPTYSKIDNISTVEQWGQFYTRYYGSYFVIYATKAEGSTGYLFRYTLLLF